MTRVLITGATGLIGRALCPTLAAAGYTVRAAMRADVSAPAGVHECTMTGDISAFRGWDGALRGVDLVVHAAGLAHVVLSGAEAQQRFDAVNAAATARLAQAAARQGVTRFVYLSSIKVNGEDSGDTVFAAADAAHPADHYGRSKLAAELELRRAAQGSAMQFAVVRPPLVYGPGVRANFLRLMRWVDRQYPLPFGAIHNRRSLVSVWNLNTLILQLLSHRNAGGRVWLVRDAEDLSTPELIRLIASAIGRRARLIDVPPRLLRTCGALVGRSAEVSRLIGSLRVDDSPARRLLDLPAPLSVEEGLARTAAWYRTQVRA